MEEKNFKKLLDEAIAPLRQDIKEVKEVQEDHTKRLEDLSGGMEQVLSEVKSTHDEIGLWHQRDKREIDDIKKHLDLPIMSDSPRLRYGQTYNSSKLGVFFVLN